MDSGPTPAIILQASFLLAASTVEPGLALLRDPPG